MSMKTLVFNGWAAGHETWDLCTFHHDWIFSYIEELDGLPERVLADTDDAILVGFSMGGTMALKCYLAHPEKIRAMVLISSTARISEDKSTGWKGMSPRRVQALKFGTRMVFRDDPSPIYEDGNLDRGLQFLADTDLRAELLSPRMRPYNERLPVDIIQSEGDFIVNPANATFLKTVFPSANVTFVPGREHVLPVSAPNLIDGAIKNILRFPIAFRREK